MRRIVRVIAENLGRAPAAVPLPGSVPAPDGFRGRVVIDPARCLGCGMCAYVCVSDAVRGHDRETGYVWEYDPARCAFCGRCVERCPGGALSQSAEPLSSYARPGELAVRVEVAFAPCPDCGVPSRAGRCERCRRAQLARALFAGGRS